MAAARSETSTPSVLAGELNPYAGVRAEIDLIACQLRLIQEPDGTSLAELPLCSQMRRDDPQLQPWGEGMLLLTPPDSQAGQRINWQPDFRYGLVFQADGCLLYQPDADRSPTLMQTRQLFYPGQYKRRPAQGPFDLFAAGDWLAVVNRGEAWVQVFDVRQGVEIGRQRFEALAGPHLISVAIDAEQRRLWLCGLDARNLWSWQPDSGQRSEHVAGKRPSALQWYQHQLWLLDVGAGLQLRQLNPDSYATLASWKLPGGSYGKDTDAPGDLLALSEAGGWLAVLSYENSPEPLSPRVSCFAPEIGQLLQPVALSGRTWPHGIATAAVNPVWQALDAQSRQLLDAAGSPPSVQALLLSYGLSRDTLPSRLLLLAAEAGETVDLPLGARADMLERLREQLREEFGLVLPEAPRNAAECALVVHAEQIVQLLRAHTRLEILINGLMQGHHLRLSIARESLIGPVFEEQQLVPGGLVVEAEEIASAPQIEALPPGWSGFADPLNSRLLQLNDAYEPVWELDTALIGIYRPTAVWWLDNGNFALLDGERSELSCWDTHAQQVWAIQTDGSTWHRFIYRVQGGQTRLTLFDREQQVLIQVDEQGQVLWDADRLPAKPAGIQDVCLDAEGRFWLLMQQGQLARMQADGTVDARRQVAGEPSGLALSPNQQQLALFDIHDQTLSLLPLAEDAEVQILQVGERRFALLEPVRMHWFDDRTVQLLDNFRLVRVGTEPLAVRERRLLQQLRRRPGQKNLAPEAAFVARHQREAQLQGGSRTSIRKMLEKVSLFDQVPDEFFAELINQLQTRVYNRGEAIVKQGEAGSEMFMLRQGQVEVLSPRGEVVARMSPGDVFGEVALMLDAPRNATIRAAGYVEVFVLARAGLERLLPAHAELGERLLKLAQDRAMQQQLRSHAEIEHLRQRPAPAPRPKPAPLSLAPLSFWVRQGTTLAAIDRSGRVSRLYAAGEHLLQPVDVCQTPAGDFVLDIGLHRLVHFDPDGQYVASYGSWGEASLNQPRSLCRHGDDSLMIANTGAGLLQQVSFSGELLETWPCGRAPVCLQAVSQGVLVTDQRLHTVALQRGAVSQLRYGTPRRFGREENLLFAPESAQQLDNGHLLIADTGNNRVIEVDAQGRIVWSLIPGGAIRLSRPTRALRLASGHTLIEHSQRSRWLEVDGEQQPVWQYQLPAEGFRRPD